MPASASTIFKIRAVADFLAPDSQQVSFRKGQAFYVLSSNPETNLYFVSTQYATPFSRTAVCGFVPISHFEVVDLHSKDPAPPRHSHRSKRSARSKSAHEKENQSSRSGKEGSSKVAASSNSSAAAANKQILGRAVAQPNAAYPSPAKSAQSARKASVDATGNTTTTVSDYEHVISDRVIGSEVSGYHREPHTTQCWYKLRVQRQHLVHLIQRSFDDFVILHNSLARQFPGEAAHRVLPTLPAPIVNSSELRRAGMLDSRIRQQQHELAQYLQSLFQVPAYILGSSAFARFFNPRDEREGEIVEFNGIRRDSGFSDSTSDPSKDTTNKSLREAEAAVAKYAAAASTTDRSASSVPSAKAARKLATLVNGRREELDAGSALAHAAQKQLNLDNKSTPSHHLHQHPPAHHQQQSQSWSTYTQDLLDAYQMRSRTPAAAHTGMPRKV
ncbi:hypothetical protein HK102_000976 [Quaeritorhiza haematococci]|nr:hypothetical protein HK102_000976 [Quaeritorhiza haematococci]